ncbi:hypothetical protein GCM10020367_31690 [Streptomyces sannanensis]|uniref:Uncharacterized protein n=1 Tax=Streptomyces sannanensis TaxID=285536 RepID=A0ABP6SCZ2_9ACTN
MVLVLITAPAEFLRVTVSAAGNPLPETPKVFPGPWVTVHVMSCWGTACAGEEAKVMPPANATATATEAGTILFFISFSLTQPGFGRQSAWQSGHNRGVTQV